MPFKSKAQRRLFWAKEERGELPKKTVLEWEHATKNKAKLPEHVKKTAAYTAGRNAAIALLFGTLLSACSWDSPATKTLMDLVVQVISVVVTPVVLMFAHRFLKEMQAKTGIALAEQEAAAIDDAIVKGIAYAREQSRKALKTGQLPPTGTEKKTLAVTTAHTILDNRRKGDINREYLEQLVEAHLNMQRDFPEQEGVGHG